MDYNSYPWLHEVKVCGTTSCYTTDKEELANEMYYKWKLTYSDNTVLQSKSRLGVVKGTPGL